jgi:hypothetical protein
MLKGPKKCAAVNVAFVAKSTQLFYGRKEQQPAIASDSVVPWATRSGTEQVKAMKPKADCPCCTLMLVRPNSHHVHSVQSPATFSHGRIRWVGSAWDIRANINSIANMLARAYTHHRSFHEAVLALLWLHAPFCCVLQVLPIHDPWGKICIPATDHEDRKQATKRQGQGCGMRL